MRCLSTQGSQCLPVLISIGAPLPQWVHPSLLSQPPSTPLSFPSQPPSAPLPSPSLTSPVHLCWYIPPSVHPSPLSSPGAPLPGAPLPQCTPHLSLAHPPRCTLTSRTASRYAPPRCTLPGATSPLSHSLPVHPHLSHTASRCVPPRTRSRSRASRRDTSCGIRSTAETRTRPRLQRVRSIGVCSLGVRIH